ncbi:Circularly permutated Ras protein 1 [Oryzias melastigma]|uniref:Circularly permutated Ras protein 1 n=1 Tax=Oryzias melastigma TaxID=30732 RepID=A0A834FJB8_ORYME|nr:Circularly permutated Ras protein 1 [Oryzias melastigma]
MEFACSHVVCDWRPDKPDNSLVQHQLDTRTVVEKGEDPPPVPPPRFRKPRPTSLPLPPLPSKASRDHLSLPPPPVPPRLDRMEVEKGLKANFNVVSLNFEKLVDLSGGQIPIFVEIIHLSFAIHVLILFPETDEEFFEKPIVCVKCGAALSCLSSVQRSVWLCEFCGTENTVDDGVVDAWVGQRPGVRGDDLYLPNRSEDDYQNLEDTLVVFCVDISGSMSVTTEVTSETGSPVYKSRLEGIQNALEGALMSMMQQSPQRRVALVTFNDEVVIYGDGTRPPLTFRDWALVDYDHVWKQASDYSIPHCIAETYHHLIRTIKELREHGATALGPAVLASVAIASKYPGSKVILCTDGKANIGLGEMEQTSSLSSSPLSSYFYKQLALESVRKGVIISVMSFKGTNCRLADIGSLADVTGGRVNIVCIETVATNIQSVSVDNVLATGVLATLLAPDGVYFPYEDENNHKLVREIGNVTRGTEITFQFAVKPEFEDVLLQKKTLPFQIQLSFKTRDQQKVTRIVTEQRPATIRSRIVLGDLNVAVLGVHCAQLCASLTMEGRVKEAKKHLKTQKDLLKQVGKLRPIQKEECIYGNWMDTMATVCHDITVETQILSDESAEVVYQMRRASSTSSSIRGDYAELAKAARRKKGIMEGVGKMDV